MISQPASQLADQLQFASLRKSKNQTKPKYGVRKIRQKKKNTRKYRNQKKKKRKKKTGDLHGSPRGPISGVPQQNGRVNFIPFRAKRETTMARRGNKRKFADFIFLFFLFSLFFFRLPPFGRALVGPSEARRYLALSSSFSRFSSFFCPFFLSLSLSPSLPISIPSLFLPSRPCNLSHAFS